MKKWKSSVGGRCIEENEQSRKPTVESFWIQSRPHKSCEQKTDEHWTDTVEEVCQSSRIAPITTAWTDPQQGFDCDNGSDNHHHKDVNPASVVLPVFTTVSVVTALCFGFVTEVDSAQKAYPRSKHQQKRDKVQIGFQWSTPSIEIHDRTFLSTDTIIFLRPLKIFSTIEKRTR